MGPGKIYNYFRGRQHQPEVDPLSQVPLEDSRGAAASNIYIVGVKAYLNYCRQPTL